MTEPFKHKSPRQMMCLGEYSVTAGITTRQNGYSEVPYDSLNMGLHVEDCKDHVLRNRESLADELQIPLNQWVMAEQVHGTDIHVVKKEDGGRGAFDKNESIANADGLITNQKNLLLAAFYADCVPLLFLDPKTQWIGLAHAGWKGTVHGMAEKMITKLTEQGASLNDIIMVIGPSISQRNYEVDQHVIDHIPEEYKEEVSISKTGNKYLLGLKELNKRLALDTGLNESHIYQTDLCTFEEDKLFYSHRRDHGRTGRMLAYIGLE
ncbi:peptidoglycan editing factor PgeF [Halobacillus amylolyticus]|uniref:Purine nucleoside phosphorylase n=1 Tax=Halobacillus amylolyticus TaxID=2932259 RepID=A0ABY4HGC1_9BACI|nr:peptidoglycan editing factor PgeF [Halobacillus amylolyticus]UOR12915.1 peptidoglycan editing factor PgeF [Halobacillus amylolyticus]